MSAGGDAAGSVTLRVPARPAFARVVRMTASTLAADLDMSVDDVEDVRMAAEEGFVYSCATRPEAVDVRFALGEGDIAMDFSLGDVPVEDVAEGGADGERTPLDLVELLLSAVCDEFGVDEAASTLHLLKRAGAADA